MMLCEFGAKLIQGFASLPDQFTDLDSLCTSSLCAPAMPGVGEADSFNSCLRPRSSAQTTVQPTSAISHGWAHAGGLPPRLRTASPDVLQVAAAIAVS